MTSSKGDNSTVKPTGTVTFLVTDIEGSTKLAQQYPDALHQLLARHHEILNQRFETYDGYAFQFDGDSFAVPLQREALPMLTRVPAASIGIEHQKGSLAPGLDADIVALDLSYQVRMTIVGGKVVYRNL